MTKQEIEILRELLDKMLFYCDLPDYEFWKIDSGAADIKKYLKELLNESNTN